MESLTGLKMQATSQKVIFCDIWDLCGEGYHYRYQKQSQTLQSSHNGNQLGGTGRN